MRYPVIISIVVVAVIGFFIFSSRKAAAAKEVPGNKKVLLELFTSQGCSSCPPADELLGKLIQQDTNIIALSFHVDYWNRLGWKDPFSSAAFSQRQQMYASALHAEVYTPQLVIQGKEEAIGSQQAKIQSSINKAKSAADINNSHLWAHAQWSKNVLTVDYAVANPSKNYIISAALVQDNTETPVHAGENTGVTLTSYNVVKELQQQNLLKSGKFSFNTHVSFQKQQVTVVVFIQNEISKQVAAAIQLKLD